MKTEAEIRIAGMQALISALGLVEAERFMVAVSRDRFNYTEWRRQGCRGCRTNYWRSKPIAIRMN